MEEVTINELPELTNVDRAADMLEVADASDLYNSKKASVNSLLNISSQPVGVNDPGVLANKTFDSSNVFVARDDRFTLQDNTDVTRQARFELSGITSGQTRVYTLPNVTDTLVSLTASQTLTNKVLTSPTITSATISNPTLTVDTISEFTSNNGVTVDGLNIKDSKLNTNNSVVTANITDSAVTSAKVATGFPVQIVSTNYSAVATGTTIIPLDDTIPQIAEGTEFMTQVITPKSATNVLVISVIALLTNSGASRDLIGAIFQDSTANALAASSQFMATATGRVILCMTHTMTAGTTSSTTFRFRAGSDQAGTTTFNGFSGARLFGAITKSSMVITEYKA